MAGESRMIRCMPRMTSGSNPCTSIFTTSKVRRANSSSAGITGTTRSYRSLGVRAPTRESPGFMGGDDMGSSNRRSPESGVVDTGAGAVRPQIGLQQAVEDRVWLDRVDLDSECQSVRKQAEVPDVGPHVEEPGPRAEQPPQEGASGFLPGLAPHEVRAHDLVAGLHPERRRRRCRSARTARRPCSGGGRSGPHRHRPWTRHGASTACRLERATWPIRAISEDPLPVGRAMQDGDRADDPTCSLRSRD